MSELILVREVASPSRRKHPGVEPGLRPTGENEARSLRSYLRGRRFETVLTSPQGQARHTAESAGLNAEVNPELIEWQHPTTSSRCSGDESLREAVDRADRVLRALRAVLIDGGDAALVAHSNVLRILTARWLTLPVSVMLSSRLTPGSVSILGWRPGRHALLVWNFNPSSWPPS
jgi:probable phosphoglycerate mutase